MSRPFPLNLFARRLRPAACPVCGGEAAVAAKASACASCGAFWRTRSLDIVLDRFAPQSPMAAPALGFAMLQQERRLIDRRFEAVTSVSLYGGYGRDHQTGVDARDLSRFADASVCAHLSILLFDYFPEHEQALAEAWRVLQPGGLFATELSDHRVKPDGRPPRTVFEIEGRPGYFSYLPSGAVLPDIRVGERWLLKAMRRAGFEGLKLTLPDPSSPYRARWFIGRKPAG